MGPSPVVLRAWGIRDPDTALGSIDFTHLKPCYVRSRDELQSVSKSGTKAMAAILATTTYVDEDDIEGINYQDFDVPPALEKEGGRPL